MNRTKWMIDSVKSNGKQSLHAFTIGIITEIVGEIHTTADAKVIEIYRTLRDLELVWNAKEPLLQTEAPKEISHVYSIIDVAKSEPLASFPMIDLGPSCKECQCFTCSRLDNCHLLLPRTMEYCKHECLGRMSTRDCRYVEPWTAELIMRNEG